MLPILRQLGGNWRRSRWQLHAGVLPPPSPLRVTARATTYKSERFFFLASSVRLSLVKRSLCTRESECARARESAREESGRSGEVERHSSESGPVSQSAMRRFCRSKLFWLFVVVWMRQAGAEKVPSAAATTDNPRSNCPHCGHADKSREVVDSLRIEAIKQQILSKLGLREKPNITWSIPREVILQTLWRADGVRQLLLDSTATPTQPETDDYYARTAEIITFAERGGSLNGQTLLEFSNSHDNPHSLRVKGATLWVQLRFRSPLVRQFRHLFHDRKVTLYVFLAQKDVNSSNSGEGSSSRINLHLLASSRVSFRHVGWKKLDLHESVRQWFAGPLGRKFSLLIDCAGCGSLIEPIFFEAEDQSPPPPGADGSSNTGRPPHVTPSSSSTSAAARGMRPFLAIVTEPVPQHRVRRRALECDSKTTQCCKQSLYISFKILEWDDWIIAPQGYYANYCMGDCARRGRTPDTFSSFHTHVIEEYKNRNPYATIQQCCAPTKLAPMSLIYFDQDSNIIKTDLPNMIVDECGCA